jgi:hypothetical protein
MMSGRLHLVLLLVLGLGCGSGKPEGPELVPVTGTVLLDGKPLPGADVTFVPTENTPGMGGSARTDEEGKFELTYARGDSGAPAGQYRVTVSRRLMPDGTPVPVDDETPPIDSPARETLPAVYNDPEQTRLTATVEANGSSVELKLESAPGRG